MRCTHFCQKKSGDLKTLGSTYLFTSCVMCQVSGVRCHMSHVTCYMFHVTCYMFHVTCNMSYIFFTKWLSYSVEGLLSTRPTTSSLKWLYLISHDLQENCDVPGHTQANSTNFRLAWLGLIFNIRRKCHTLWTMCSFLLIINTILNNLWKF